MNQPTRQPPPPVYRRSPAPPPPPAYRQLPAQRPRRGVTDRTRQVLGIGAAVAVGVGCVLPWASATVPFYDSANIAGTDTDDGKIILSSPGSSSCWG